eukprot:TRINITY_DN1349_c0_g1_i14.p1 TRINITY_DN1349_c0_g1~~TRINITY_DN1349_c0_g1_i14.p1  ORF type:complete len:244 (-),score=88.60 TRINITY_DN1349_c0_g1_i14:1081-1812(-)
MASVGRRCRLLSPVSVAVVAVAGVVAVAVVAAGRPAAAADAPDHDPHQGEFDYYREWGNEHLAADHAPDGNDANAKTVHDEYESFVEGVENVMTDQRAASSKRDVVDLGQSLHMLDRKFEHLKAGLYEQIAAGASRKGNKASVAAEGRALAQKVKTKYSNLRTVAREVLDMLAKNARAADQVGDTMSGLEKVVGELQKHLEKHHKEVAELGSSVQRLHDSSHVLMETHSSATEAAMSATKKAY